MEHNKFCVSVHFRNCEPEQLDKVVGAVEAVLAGNSELKATRGRKVLEIRPQVPFSVLENCSAHHISRFHRQESIQLWLTTLLVTPSKLQQACRTPTCAEELPESST